MDTVVLNKEWGEFEIIGGKISETRHKVCVHCLSYNFKRYISQSLDSILSQRFNESMYIFIFDDASTDGSDELIRDYARRYPDKILAVLAKKNSYGLGYRGELSDELNKRYINSDYVAKCELDDFWIDNNKIQIQNDYLDEHPECSMCVHDSVVYNEVGMKFQPIDVIHKDYDATTADLLKWWLTTEYGCFQTSSHFFRRNLLIDSKYFDDCPIGDWPSVLYASLHGNIYYLNRVMSVYRYFHEGSWSERTAENEMYRIDSRMQIARFLRRFDILDLHRNIELIEEMIESYLKVVVNVADSQTYNSILAKYNNIAKCKNEYFYVLEKLEFVKKKDDEVKEKIRLFIEAHKYVYIMGTGDYSSLLTKKMKDMNCEFDAYVVSDSQQPKEIFYGKKVYQLCELQHDKNDVGIIIGIKNTMNNGIENILLMAGYTDYVWSI